MPQTDALFSAELFSSLSSWLTQLFIALLLLIVGWLCARLLRALTERLIVFITNYTLPFKAGQTETLRRVPPASKLLIPKLVYWVTVLIFVGLAANALQLTLFAGWVNAIVAYLPNLTIGLLILFGGFICGELVREGISQAAHLAHFKGGEWVGRAGQWTIICASAIVGLTQLGIDVTLLSNLATLAFGAIAGAFAIGVALGAPTHVSNFMSARYVQRVFQVGEHIQLGDAIGIISDISAYAVIIETDTGKLHIPAKMFVDTPCLKLPPTEPSHAHKQASDSSTEFHRQKAAKRANIKSAPPVKDDDDDRS